MRLHQLVKDIHFDDPLWQERHTITRPEQLREVLDEILHPSALDDMIAGLHQASMSVRINPYLLDLINWQDMEHDPIRRQFLPLASEMTASHPLQSLDALDETADSPVEGLVHRYPDRALLLVTDRCPVYCRFCTRSYNVGVDTSSVIKIRAQAISHRWQSILSHLRMTPRIVDVVVSGGDCARLKASQLLEIGRGLLSIPSIRRIRFASKGLSVLPMKITRDHAWTDALTVVSDEGRRQGVEVSLQTHFNHPIEITPSVLSAANLLFAKGVMVRNQSVLLRGVNDDASVLGLLIKHLGDLHIHPYYVYLCDPVPGIEDMRVDLATACQLEKAVRGLTAGYNMPAFVVDAPGGGGKRLIHSYERYDRYSGLSTFTAPAVKADRLFLYPDPLHALSPDARRDWLDPQRAQAMVADMQRQSA